VGADVRELLDELLPSSASHASEKRVATYESLFDLRCDGLVYTVVAGSGLAHRAPPTLMRTLCDVPVPAYWEPRIGAVTCEECRRRGR
jgi:hypothetical protein